jgi:DnaA family protein
MRQLLLDWGAARPQTLDSFVIGRNHELAALLRRIAAGETSTLDQRFVSLWGEAGAGKSHVLHALNAKGGARLLTPELSSREFVVSANCQLYLIDDCERLNDRQQHALFNLINQLRDNGGTLVAAASHPPGQLPLREDLRTRLGWGLVYQLHGLSDEEKIDALSKSAQARGLSLSTGVLPYLLTHFRRDMQSLSTMLDALDRYSLETQRPITMPLLRELLQLDDTDTPT